MREKCRPSDHVDQLIRTIRGSHVFRRVRCVKCGDVFPCRHDCDHFDCRIERGEALPDWARLVAS